MNVEEKLDALKSYVKSRASEDAQSLIADAGKKAQAIKKNYDNKAEKAQSQIMNDAKKRIDEIKRSEKSQAISKASRLTIEGQKNIIDDSTKLLKSEFLELSGKASYPALLKYLLIEALNVIDAKKVMVKVRKEDHDLIVKIIAQIKTDKEITISDESIQISGGVVLSSEGGKEIVENTLENKFEELKEEFLKELFSRLKVR